MLVTLSQELVRLGCEVVVAAFRDSRNPHTEVVESVQRMGLPIRIIDCRGRWDANAVGQIRNALRQDKVDVLHTHGYKADLYGYAACWQRPRVLVSTCHNWPSRRALMRAYAVLDRLVLRAFDCVTTPSREVEKILNRSGIKPAKLSYIGNGVDIARYQNAPPTLRVELGCGTRPVIGFVGRMVPGKGGETLLNAAASVLSEFPHALFAFVGEGPLRTAWQAHAEGLGIGRQVVFTGERSDMPGIYSSLDMLVLPSFDEAMPMCVLEAQASATPVVATRVGSVPDVIVDGATGLLLEPGDAAGLSKSILRLLGDSKLKSELGRNGRARVSQAFSSNGMAQEYLGLYQKILGEAVVECSQAASLAK